MAELRIATRDGGEQVIATTQVERFQERMQGDVLRPGDAGYDAARTVWNGMVDKRPAVIARCISAADVVACVTFA